MRKDPNAYAIGCVGLVAVAVISACGMVAMGWLFGIGLRLSGL